MPSKLEVRKLTERQEYVRLMLIGIGFTIAIGASVATGGFIYVALKHLVLHSPVDFISAISLSNIQLLATGAGVYYFFQDGDSFIEKEWNRLIPYLLEPDKIWPLLRKKYNALTWKSILKPLVIGGMLVLYTLVGIGGMEGSLTDLWGMSEKAWPTLYRFLAILGGVCLAICDVSENSSTLLTRSYQLFIGEHPFKPETKTQWLFLVIACSMALVSCVALGGFVFTDLHLLVTESVFSTLQSIPMWVIYVFSSFAAIDFLFHDAWSGAKNTMKFGKHVSRKWLSSFYLFEKAHEKLTNLSLEDILRYGSILVLFGIGFCIGGLAGFDGSGQMLTQIFQAPIENHIWTCIAGGLCFAYSFASQDVPTMLKRFWKIWYDPERLVEPRTEEYDTWNDSLRVNSRNSRGKLADMFFNGAIESLQQKGIDKDLIAESLCKLALERIGTDIDTRTLFIEAMTSRHHTEITPEGIQTALEQGKIFDYFNDIITRSKKDEMYEKLMTTETSRSEP